MLRRILTVIFILFLTAFAAGCGLLCYLLSWDVVPLDLCERREYAKASLVLDDQGAELFRFERDRRSYTSIQAIPETLIRAFIATEDHDFFKHMGLSLKGIIRSAAVNLARGRVVQGASTITQQVARLLFLSHERTLWRKIKEQFLALQLERALSKEQILELYLNNMYFGRGIYGVEAACQRFWNKSVTDVSLDEAAVLAAIAKSARFYSPLNSMASALKRRNTVLHSMMRCGFITEDVYNFYLAKPLVISDPLQGNKIRLYLQEWIRVWAEQKWGKDTLYTDGLIIKTSINQKIQAAAEQAFLRSLEPMRQKGGDVFNGGLMTIEVQSGAIKAAVGGVDFHQSQFNRAFQAYRQIGSSFKPYLYALALDRGFTMTDLFVDEPLTVIMPNGAQWRPKNWYPNFAGEMTLARALTTSSNIIAVKLLLELGVRPVMRCARQFKFCRGIQAYPSLALGTAEATVLENVAAFNVFARLGSYVQPFLIESVIDEHGKRLWQHEAKEERIINPIVASKMVNALSHRMEINKRAAHSKGEGWLEMASIGKTGSTNGAATTWFVGSTPEYTTAVYVGRDDNKPMGSVVFASKTAYPIWLELHKSLPQAKKEFYVDPQLEIQHINWLTGRPVYGVDDGELYNNQVIPLLTDEDGEEG